MNFQLQILREPGHTVSVECNISSNIFLDYIKFRLCLEFNNETGITGFSNLKSSKAFSSLNVFYEILCWLSLKWDLSAK
jgi:hypothetical protein